MVQRLQGQGDPWFLFSQECERAFANKNPQLFQKIILEYKGLIDEEFGEGTFTCIQKNQKRIKEYARSLPKIEFYMDRGFLLPRVVSGDRSGVDSVREKILKEGLDKCGAFDLQNLVRHSQSKETIRSKYGVIIDLMLPQFSFEPFGLYGEWYRQGRSQRDTVKNIYLRLIEAKGRGDKEFLSTTQNYFPGIYNAFLSSI